MSSVVTSRNWATRLTAAGRMEPNKYIHTAWRTRTRPQSLQARPNQVQSAEAVPAAPLNRGLMVVVKELLDSPEREPYLKWYQTEHVPRVLDTGLFTGAVTVMGSDAERQHHMAVLFYTAEDDVLAVYVELQKKLAEWRTTGASFLTRRASRGCCTRASTPTVLASTTSTTDRRPPRRRKELRP